MFATSAPVAVSRRTVPGATGSRSCGLAGPRRRPAPASRPQRWFVAAKAEDDSPAPGPNNGATPPPGGSGSTPPPSPGLHFEKEIARELVNWCNYKAVRTVLGQLEETDPVRFRELHLWVADHQTGLKDPETFNMEMLRWNREMALRVFATRDLIHDELKFWKVLEVFNERVGSMKKEVMTDLLERAFNAPEAAKPEPAPAEVAAKESSPATEMEAEQE
eukprot:tig00021537_g22306.t1